MINDVNKERHFNIKKGEFYSTSIFTNIASKTINVLLDFCIVCLTFTFDELHPNIVKRYSLLLLHPQSVYSVLPIWQLAPLQNYMYKL